MNQNKARITAVALVCMLTVSLAACNKQKNDDSKTTVVNNTNKAGESTTVPEYKYPETDSNGNKITMVEVTDKEGKKVTDTKGSVVTQVGVLNKDGALITEKNGALVTPSLKDNGHTVAVNPSTATPGATEENQIGSVVKVGSGPTVRLLNASDDSDQITGKAGDQIVLKLSSDANPGYSALYSWIDVNTDIFEIVKYEPGDPTLPDYKKSPAKAGSTLKTFKKSEDASKYPTNINKTDNFTTILCLYFDSNLKKLTEKTTLATITLKIKDSVKAGEYSVDFDSIQDAGKSQCNYIEDGTKNIVSATPKFVNAKVKVQ